MRLYLTLYTDFLRLVGVLTLEMDSIRSARDSKAGTYMLSHAPKLFVRNSCEVYLLQNNYFITNLRCLL